MPTLGDRLVKARERNGWDQKEAAVKLKWAASTLSQYETNSRKPNPQRLRHICETYHVAPGFILGITDNPEFIREDLTQLAPEEIFILDEMRSNPDFGVAFSEFLAAPERKRKEFLRMWKVYKELAEQGEDDGMEEE